MEQIPAANEVPWTAADEAWLGSINPEWLRPIAKRHGRVLFQIVMQAGVIGESLGAIQASAQQVAKWGQKRHVEAFLMASARIQQVAHHLCLTALAGHKLDMRRFMECKQDVERAGALATTGDGKPAGRIIVSH